MNLKNQITIIVIIASLILLSASNIKKNNDLTYPIVDTGQEECFNNSGKISQPLKGNSFYGQDAQHIGHQPSYTDNDDGTVTDNVTGLMWQKSFEVMSYDEAVKKIKTFKLGGYSDWRIPTIKEAYSLIMFSGADVSGKDMNNVPGGALPFIDNKYFNFEYGSNGVRIIDTQIMSSTIYKGKTMKISKTLFGVNVADGRIKGYPIMDMRSGESKDFTVRFVRGNSDYGKNKFFDNGNSTISDLSTGLMWDKNDSKKSMDWEDALNWVQEKNKENYLGYSDWRLPNIKELQSIVDYTRSLQETKSAAIDPIFNISLIKDEGKNTNYPFFWSSTTHKNMRDRSNACYVAFGEALGFFQDPRTRKKELMDVHGAGAQRSDPKSGDPSRYSQGHGPQGDVIRIYNYVRLVRDIN